MKILKSIGILFGICVIVLMPVIINLLFNIGERWSLITTRFNHVDILLYFGAISAFFATIVLLVQNQRLHASNTKLRMQRDDLELARKTYAYLIINRIDASPRKENIKTYTLEKAIPWPLDVRATPLGFPEGIPNNLPFLLRRKIKKCLPPLPLGNSKDYCEEKIEEEGQIVYQSEHGKSWLQIDPYKGTFMSGGFQPQFVLWQKNFPIPRYYKYYTPLNIRFYATSTRKDTIVREVVINKMFLTLRCKKGDVYAFFDHLDYKASFIRESMIIQTTVVPQTHSQSYDHTFALELHLCHSYDNMLSISRFNEIDIEISADYVNSDGVRTNYLQGFIFGMLEKDVIDSKIFGANGQPMQKIGYKYADVRHYRASAITVSIHQTEVNI